MRNIDHSAIVKDTRPPEEAWITLGYANLVLSCGQKLPNITTFENKHISSVGANGIGHLYVGKHRVLWGGDDASMEAALGKYAGNAKNTVVVGKYGKRVDFASKGAAKHGRTIFVFDPTCGTAPDCIRIRFDKDNIEVLELDGVRWVPYNPNKEPKTDEEIAAEVEQKQKIEKERAKRRSARRKQKKKVTK